MSRVLKPGCELVIATHNAGKMSEIAALLEGCGFILTSAGDLGLSEPEETGSSFEENAALKALAAARVSGRPALADDSGLSVEALGGDPGIYSARWAVREDGQRDFSYAMEKVRLALGGAQDRRAAFVCVLALGWPDGHVDCFEGRVSGVLRFPPCGERGFGYDPIFVPDGHNRTFAEMDPAEKQALSHRARAFECFTAAMEEIRQKA